MMKLLYFLSVIGLFLSIQSPTHQFAVNKPPHQQLADSSTVKLRNIASGVWMHTSYHAYKGQLIPSNGLIVKVADHLLLIDAAWGVQPTKKLIEMIEQRIGLPVQKAIVTHFHNDRTAGVDFLEAHGIEVYTHPLTPKLAKEVGNPVPNHVLRKLKKPGSTIQFGPVEIFYPGPAHARDNIVVWIPDNHIIYGGCAIRNLSTTTLGNTADADVMNWPAAIKRIQKRYSGIEIVIPGHGKPGGPELLEHTLQLFHH